MTNGGFGVLGTSDDATGVYGLSGSEIGVFGAGRLEWKDTGNIMESVEQGMAARVWLEYMGKVLSTMEYTESGTLEWTSGQGQNVGVHGGGENYGVLQSMCL